MKIIRLAMACIIALLVAYLVHVTCGNSNPDRPNRGIEGLGPAEAAASIQTANPLEFEEAVDVLDSSKEGQAFPSQAMSTPVHGYGAVAVSVVSSVRTPMPGVEVSIWYGRYDYDESSALKVLSNSTGNCYFGAVPVGEVRVGIGRIVSTLVRVDAGQTSSVTLEVDGSGNTLCCRIVDVNGGSVVGASVFISDYGSRVFSKILCCTNDEGVACENVVAQGRSLFATHEDYLPSEVVFCAPSRDNESNKTLQLHTGDPGAVELGVVADGAPVAGADVEMTLSSRPPKDLRLALTTNSQGQLAIEGLWPERYHVTARFDGKGVCSREIDVSSGSTCREVLELSAGARLVGTVFNESGELVPYANVWIRHSLFPHKLLRQECGVKGQFTFNNLWEGHVNIVANDSNGSKAESSAFLVDGTTTETNLTLLAGKAVVGTLRSTNGEPLVGWPVGIPDPGNPELWTVWDRTIESGAFIITDVPEGGGVLEVRSPSKEWGFVVHRELVDFGVEWQDLVVNVERCCSSGLSGYVTVEGHGALPEYFVVVRRVGDRLGQEYLFSEEQFAVGGLPSGEVEVVFAADGLVRHAFLVHLKPGVTTDMGAIALRRGGSVDCSLEGKVDAQRIRVELRRLGDAGPLRILTLRAGRATAGELEPGNYKLTVLVDGVPAKSEDFVVQPGECSFVGVKL